jgi:hypothetical protein
VTAVGVFNLVLGALEVLFCGWTMIQGGAIFGAAAQGQAEVEKAVIKAGARPEDLDKLRDAGVNPGGIFQAMAGVIIFLALIGLVIAALRIWAGVGVLNRRPWARTMTIVLASISIVFVILGLLSILNIQGALFFVIYLAYVLTSFIILLNSRNAAEFRRAGPAV